MKVKTYVQYIGKNEWEPRSKK